MDHIDLIYHNLLDKVKKTEPVLDDVDGLTECIMQRIEPVSVTGKRTRILRISGALSGVAASALICLLIYETLKYPVSPPLKEYPGYVSQSPLPDYLKIDSKYPGHLDHLTPREKRKIVENILEKKEVQRKQREHRCASFMIRSRISVTY